MLSFAKLLDIHNMVKAHLDELETGIYNCDQYMEPEVNVEGIHGQYKDMIGNLGLWGKIKGYVKKQDVLQIFEWMVEDVEARIEEAVKEITNTQENVQSEINELDGIRWMITDEGECFSSELDETLEWLAKLEQESPNIVALLHPSVNGMVYKEEVSE